MTHTKNNRWFIFYQDQLLLEKKNNAFSIPSGESAPIRHTGRNNRTHPNYARWHIRQKFLHRFSDHRNTGICTNGVARFL